MAQRASELNIVSELITLARKHLVGVCFTILYNFLPALCALCTTVVTPFRGGREAEGVKPAGGSKAFKTPDGVEGQRQSPWVLSIFSVLKA